MSHRRYSPCCAAEAIRYLESQGYVVAQRRGGRVRGMCDALGSDPAGHPTTCERVGGHGGLHRAIWKDGRPRWWGFSSIDGKRPEYVGPAHA